MNLKEILKDLESGVLVYKEATKRLPYSVTMSTRIYDILAGSGYVKNNRLSINIDGEKTKILCIVDPRLTSMVVGGM